MTETAPEAVQVKSPKNPRKKRTSTGRMHAFPLVKLVMDALFGMKDRKGTSIFKIKKYIASKGVDVKSCNRRINKAVTTLVDNGKVKRVSGRGASGSFKLCATAVPKTAKPAKQNKKPVKRNAKPKDAKRSRSTTPKKKDSKKGDAKKAAAGRRSAGKPAALKRKKTNKKDEKKKAPKRVSKKDSPKKTTSRKRVAVKRSGSLKVQTKRTAGKKAGARKSGK